MKTNLFICIIISSILLLGCSTIQVSQDYEPSFNFSSLKTYTWQTAEQEKTGDVRIDNPLLDKRIRLAVDRSLNKKGYQRSEQGKQDFYVAYKMTIQKRLETDNINTGIGFGIGTFGRHGGISISSGKTLNEYDEALIVVDIINAANNELMWRGKSTSRMPKHSTPEKTTESVNNIIEKIMEQFPPE